MMEVQKLVVRHVTSSLGLFWHSCSRPSAEQFRLGEGEEMITPSQPPLYSIMTKWILMYCIAVVVRSTVRTEQLFNLAINLNPRPFNHFCSTEWLGLGAIMRTKVCMHGDVD